MTLEERVALLERQQREMNEQWKNWFGRGVNELTEVTNTLRLMQQIAEQLLEAVSGRVSKEKGN
jgi:hypothetical protein